MNPSISLTRSCAHHCSRASKPSKRILVLQHQPSRFISSSRPQQLTQPTDLSTASSSHPTEPNAFSQTPPAPQPSPSHLPEDQSRPPPSTLYTGTISRSGTMPHTVQITRNRLQFDAFLQKHYTRPLRLKAHDPHPPSYLREGDVVEYSTLTPEERATKAARDEARVARTEARLAEKDASGKTVRAFQRSEATRRRMQGRKVRGVQFVVRRVVTPFGVGLEERMGRLAVEEEGEGRMGLGMEGAREEARDELLRGLGGSVRRRRTGAKAGVAG